MCGTKDVQRFVRPPRFPKISKNRHAHFPPTERKIGRTSSVLISADQYSWNTCSVGVCFLTSRSIWNGPLVTPPAANGPSLTNVEGMEGRRRAKYSSSNRNNCRIWFSCLYTGRYHAVFLISIMNSRGRLHHTAARGILGIPIVCPMSFPKRFLRKITTPKRWMNQRPSYFQSISPPPLRYRERVCRNRNGFFRRWVYPNFF